eukprot:8494-Heterococcus_DN1.PRE.6
MYSKCKSHVGECITVTAAPVAAVVLHLLRCFSRTVYNYYSTSTTAITTACATLLLLVKQCAAVAGAPVMAANCHYYSCSPLLLLVYSYEQKATSTKVMPLLTLPPAVGITVAVAAATGAAAHCS